MNKLFPKCTIMLFVYLSYDAHD